MLGLCTAMLIPPLLTMTSKGDMDFVGFVSGSFLVCFSGIWLGSRWASRLTRKQQNARPSGSSQAA
jgi:hypothetical protein